MTVVAVLGAGAGGLAAVADLGSRGHRVRLYNRSAETLGRLLHGEPIAYRGVLGDGASRPEYVGTDLETALHGAEAVVICQPALAHRALFTALARAGCGIPIVLNPGHTGGALHARAVFGAENRPLPPIAEMSTLTYVARKPAPEAVSVTGRAGSVQVAALPGGGQAVTMAQLLFPVARLAADVLATSLANVNLVLHPPGAVLAAAWVEATGGDFTFYVQGMTNGVVRVIQRLDAERLAVGKALGHQLLPLQDEMAAIGTVNRDVARDDLGAAIRGGRANESISAPQSLAHRYYLEDFPYGLVPFLALAEIAGVRCPVAESLLTLGEAATGERFRADGLNAGRLGITDCSPGELRSLCGAPR